MCQLLHQCFFLVVNLVLYVCGLLSSPPPLLHCSSTPFHIKLLPIPLIPPPYIESTTATFIVTATSTPPLFNSPPGDHDNNNCRSATVQLLPLSLNNHRTIAAPLFWFYASLALSVCSTTSGLLLDSTTPHLTFTTSGAPQHKATSVTDTTNTLLHSYSSPPPFLVLPSTLLPLPGCCSTVIVLLHSLLSHHHAFFIRHYPVFAVSGIPHLFYQFIHFLLSLFPLVYLFAH